MIENLENANKKLLIKYFNNYCLFVYGRLYPLTENNVINYFQDACDVYFKESSSLNVIVKVKKVNEDTIKVFYSYNQENFTHIGNLIIDNILLNRQLLELLDKKIYDNKNR